MIRPGRALPAALAIVAVAAGGALLLTTPAGAAPAGAAPAAVGRSTVAAVSSDCTLHSVSPDGGAFVCFAPHGEHLWVCDDAADGHHPGVSWKVDNGAEHAVSYDLGYGNCKDINLDLPESSVIHYLAVNYEGSKAISIGPVRDVSARG